MHKQYQWKAQVPLLAKEAEAKSLHHEEFMNLGQTNPYQGVRGCRYKGFTVAQ